MYIDFHCHFINEEILLTMLNKCEYLCLSFYNTESFEQFYKLKSFNDSKIKVVVGCHPWYLNEDFLSKVLSFNCFYDNFKNRINGIGEIGFDFINGNFSNNLPLQENYFLRQLEFAINHNMPVVIHSVKGIKILEKYIDLLKKLKKCLFHGFSGTFSEANFFIKNNVNCIFSFGKNVITDNKRALETISKLPIEFLGLESDFTVKNQINIEDVYKKVYNIRKNLDNLSYEKFCECQKSNFLSIFT